MKKIVLDFTSIFDVFEFKKQANVTEADVKVNLLIGNFTPLQIDLALNLFHAKVLDERRTQELIN